LLVHTGSVQVMTGARMLLVSMDALRLPESRARQCMGKKSYPYGLPVTP